MSRPSDCGSSCDTMSMNMILSGPDVVLRLMDTEDKFSSLQEKAQVQEKNEVNGKPRFTWKIVTTQTSVSVSVCAVSHYTNAIVHGT